MGSNGQILEACVYLYTFPGFVLPARPALCSADALEVGTITRESVKLSGLNHRIFTNPQSTTIQIEEKELNKELQISCQFVPASELTINDTGNCN